MQISDHRRYDLAIANQQSALARIDRAQQQIATGRRVLRPSDSPSAAGEAAGLRGAEADAANHLRSLSDARAWLGTQDSALQSAGDVMRRVQDLVLRSQNPALNAEGRGAIATELDGLRDQLAAIANTKYRGQAVFGAFADSAVLVTPGSATFQGQPGAVVQRRISDDEVITVNTDGYEAFGFAAGDDVFTVMSRISANVRSGNNAAVASDASVIAARTDDLRDALGVVGTRAARVDATSTQREDDLAALRRRRSDIEDADLAESATELARAQQTYEAILASVASIDRLSLVDFLR